MVTTWCSICRVLLYDFQSFCVLLRRKYKVSFTSVRLLSNICSFSILSSLFTRLKSKTQYSIHHLLYHCIWYVYHGTINFRYTWIKILLWNDIFYSFLIRKTTCIFQIMHAPIHTHHTLWMSPASLVFLWCNACVFMPDLLTLQLLSPDYHALQRGCVGVLGNHICTRLSADGAPVPGYKSTVRS